MRNADTSIPIMLGNLRQEIEAEKVLLRYRSQEGDRYEVFPKPRRKRNRKRQEASQLLENTLSALWQQFKNVERPFLIKSPVRAEEVQRGDYWGDSDVEEKPVARPSKSNERRTEDRMGMAEAGLPSDEQRYYRTDMTHRFIWWQSQSSVISMLDQVQRIQIRRIERDVFETDELVKRCLRKLGGQRGGRRSGDGGSSPDRDGGRAASRESLRRRSAGSWRRSASFPHRRSTGTGGQFRDVDEKETIRVRPRRDVRTQDDEASDPGRRRRRRESQPRREYEIVQPGRIYVDVDDGRSRP